MTAAEVPAAMLLKNAAGWNQTEQDWRNLLQLAPDGCFRIRCDGRLAATTSAVCFGTRLAWIGMVLTDAEYRGRGFARQLMEHALEYLGNSVEWIKLDATDMGWPLYRKLGFEDECPIERWGRAARESAPCPEGGTRSLLRNGYRAGSFGELDFRAFGADRGELLSLLGSIESAEVPEEGYAMGRPGARAAYFGPCVSRSPDAARELLQWFLARHPSEPIYWDLLPDNREAVKLARDFGFERLRELVRMVRPAAPGGPFTSQNSNVFAIAGFEYG